MSHTPWKIEVLPAYDLFENKTSYTLAIVAGNDRIALLGNNKKAKAELIVNAVNSYQPMREALEETLAALVNWLDEYPPSGCGKGVFEAVGAARQALALATGHPVTEKG